MIKLANIYTANHAVCVIIVATRDKFWRASSTARELEKCHLFGGCRLLVISMLIAACERDEFIVIWIMTFAFDDHMRKAWASFQNFTGQLLVIELALFTVNDVSLGIGVLAKIANF